MTTFDPYILDHQRKIEAFKETNMGVFEEKMLEFSSNPVDLVDLRLQADSTSNFRQFIDHLIRLWNMASSENEVSPIIREKPNNREIDTSSAITYKLLGRRHTPDTYEVKPKLRTTVKHPHREGEFVDVLGQLFDLKVGFTINATTAEKADDLVDEFENFMIRYAGYFKLQGVSEIIFSEQLEDEVIASEKVQYHKRPLIFKVRLERLTIRSQNEIEQIDLQAQIYNKSE